MPVWSASCKAHKSFFDHAKQLKTAEQRSIESRLMPYNATVILISVGGALTADIVASAPKPISPQAMPVTWTTPSAKSSRRL